MQEHYFIGKLILDENNQSKMNYIVRSLVDNNEQSITELLDRIYNSTNTISKMMRIVIKPFNSTDVFGGFQSLCIKKDIKYGTYSYHICDFPLENTLFELVGSNIEAWVEDYTDYTKEMDMGDTRHGKSS